VTYRLTGNGDFAARLDAPPESSSFLRNDYGYWETLATLAKLPLGDLPEGTGIVFTGPPLNRRTILGRPILTFHVRVPEGGRPQLSAYLLGEKPLKGHNIITQGAMVLRAAGTYRVTLELNLTAYRSTGRERLKLLIFARDYDYLITPYYRHDFEVIYGSEYPVKIKMNLVSQFD